jgi:hypothetical protein
MVTGDTLRIAELTSGSGLIGLHLLRIERNSRLIGLDVDPTAAVTALRNANFLGLTRRARFTTVDLRSRRAASLLVREKPQLIVCNPPYVPEPPGQSLEVEAGAGADGTAYIIRTLELAHITRPRALALSWCSLSDPEGIVKAAEENGYQLNSLFIAVIADGEYSGQVGDYLKQLDSGFLNDSRETLKVVAPDGSASFSYLLMAGDFSKKDAGRRRGTVRASDYVRTICSRFARRGIASLSSTDAPFPVRAWLLDRWDEVRLRAFLHGRVERVAVQPA